MTLKDENLNNIDNQKSEKGSTAPFFSLFHYATKLDIIYTVLGCIFATVGGALMPAFSIIFGRVMDEFANPSSQGFLSTVNSLSLMMLYVAMGKTLCIKVDKFWPSLFYIPSYFYRCWNSWMV